MFKKLWNKITGKEDHSLQEQNQEIEQQESSNDSSEPNELIHDELTHEEIIHDEKALAEKALDETVHDENIEEFSSEEHPKVQFEQEHSKEELKGKTVETQALAEKILEEESLEEAPEKALEEESLEEAPEKALEEETFKKETFEDESLKKEELEQVDFEQTQASQKEQIEQTSALKEQFEQASALEEEQFEPAQALEEEQKPKKGFFKKLFEGLDKTRKNITDKIDNLIYNYGKIDDDLFDELEEILIMSDISMDTSLALIASLREELVKRKITDASLVKSTLRDVIVNFLNTEEEAKISDNYPTIILVIGVNGAGKTTTIGKLANKYKTSGKSVILAAADTFRAAAIDQLQVWGNRSGVRVIAHSEGSDPSAVIFDAINAAKSSKTDILICDTAGRLHNKVNLMNELNKMFRIIEREYPEANKEVLIVLDATTGQNALNQAKLFKEVADITGLVLTKLDGAAKGGFVLSIKHDLGIPLKLIGVGEGIDDLQEFKPIDFANALMDLEQKSEA